MTAAFKYSGDYVLIGPPGVGKTTFLARQLEAIMAESRTAFGTVDRKPALVCSLTRAAAAEIAFKANASGLPPECIGTLHSHAYRAIGMPKVVAGKLLKQWNEEQPALALSSDTPDAEEPEWDSLRGGEAPGDEASSLFHLLRARMAPKAAWPEQVLAFSAKWEEFKERTDSVDFTDMIEYAYEDCPFAPGLPRVVIADEAQDCSALEFALLKKWGAAAGCLIAVGDPWQALYTWRGADPDFLIAHPVPDGHRRVLPQSYRVPRAVHAAATAWARKLSTWAPIEYRPRDEEGEVRRSPASCRSPDRLIESALADVEAGRTAMIAASCSYLLAPIIAELRRRGVPFCNRWRRRRGDWNPLATPGKGVSMAQRILALLRIDPQTEERPALWTAAELARWSGALRVAGVLERGARELLVAAAAPGGKEQRPLTWDELGGYLSFDALDFLLGWAERRGSEAEPATLAEALCWYSERLAAARTRPAEYAIRVALERGPDELAREPQLYVGTIHSFKGAEADDVYLMPDISPAGKAEWEAGGASRDGVVRMFYVGMTRARRSLTILRSGTGIIPNEAPFTME